MKHSFIIIVIVFFAACNPTKQVMRNQEQFEKIGRAWEKGNPCPPPKTSIKLGKIDSIKIPVIKLVPTLDTSLLRKKLDSLNKTLREKYNEIEKDCSRQVNEAYDVGYQQAMYEAGNIKIPAPIHDTLTYEDTRRIELAKTDLVKAADEKRDLQIFLANEKAKANKWFWIAMSLSVGLISLIIVIVTSKFYKK